jgi:hypothetical protein
MTKPFPWPALPAVSVALAATLLLGTHVISVSASDARAGELQVIKNCNNYTGQAGSYCTITSSNLAQIPSGTRVFYDQAFGISNPNPPGGMLDSNVLLYVGTGDWAVGRCTLDGNTNLGLCSFSDGVGPLTAFHARLDVSPASGTNNYHWDGPYSFVLPID